MTAFSGLSSIVRALFSLWALLLCLSDIVCALTAAVKKRYAFTVLSLILLLPVYFMWQIIFDLSLSHGGAHLSAISRAATDIPWIWWFVACISFTAVSSFVLVYNIRYDKRNITPGAIKSFLDGIPCGICCYCDNGKVLFSNICINRLCTDITGAPLLNGNHFKDAVKDGIITADGKVWRFSCREIVSGGQTLHEIIASDITAEYAETQALERDRAELARLNRDLKEYTLSIDENVRQREILQAKVNIHNEMNRLMLSTVAAESGDPAAHDRIFSLWEQNALLLCMEAERPEEPAAVSRIEKLADALKIRLIWQNDIPAQLTESERNLFFSAAQEAIANAAKHAQAKTVTVSFTVTEDGVCCDITNDGKMPDGKIKFSGGLANLAYLSKKQGASISASSGERFTLSLHFPKNQPNG